MIRRKIPIRIKNVENPKGGGTVIHPDVDGAAAAATSADSFTASSDTAVPPVSAQPTISTGQPPLLHQEHLLRLPTAVTIKEGITVLNVNSNRKSVSHGFLAGIFGTLDKFGVVVDLISTSEVHVSMAIEDERGKKVLERVVRELRKMGTVSTKERFVTTHIHFSM